MGKTGHTMVDNLWDIHFHAPILKSADGLDDNLIGALFGFVFVKFDMLCAFYLDRKSVV